MPVLPHSFSGHHKYEDRVLCLPLPAWYPRPRCPQLFWGTLPLLLSSLCIEGFSASIPWLSTLLPVCTACQEGLGQSYQLCVAAEQPANDPGLSPLGSRAII